MSLPPPSAATRNRRRKGLLRLRTRCRATCPFRHVKLPSKLLRNLARLLCGLIIWPKLITLLLPRALPLLVVSSPLLGGSWVSCCCSRRKPIVFLRSSVRSHGQMALSPRQQPTERASDRASESVNIFETRFSHSYSLSQSGGRRRTSIIHWEIC